MGIERWTEKKYTFVEEEGKWYVHGSVHRNIAILLYPYFIGVLAVLKSLHRNIAILRSKPKILKNMSPFQCFSI